MNRLFNMSVLFLGVYQSCAWAAERFERVSVHLEQTIEDGDVEIAFEAISGTAGLTALKVVAPDGRTVADFKAADSRLGMRQITLESPEPKNDGSLQADFAAGSYRFTGTLTTGTTLQGEATLSHGFPGTARIVQPRTGEHGVPVAGLQVRWAPVRNAAGYIVVLEHEKTGRQIKADLGGSATTFAVPDGFLAPGLEYKLAVGAVGKDGNRTVSEIDFTTAGKKVARSEGQSNGE
jgi:hypothetical protein